MSVSKFRGIIIKEALLGEADKMLTFFTKEHGKYHARARGARKLKSKYLAGSHVFCYGDFVVFSGNSFNSITQIDIIESFYNLRVDYDSFAYGSYILEVLDKSTYEGSPNEAVLKLVLKTFQYMGKENSNLKIVFSVFIFKYMEFSGYVPETDICVGCGVPMDKNELYFGREGTVCEKCRNIHGARKISFSALYAINYIIQSEIKGIFNFNAKEDVIQDLMTAANIFIENLEINLKSKEMIE